MINVFWDVVSNILEELAASIFRVQAMRENIQ
jgi:hypothetical protein